MAVSSAEQLRLLNLAYRQMQLDVRRISPDLFRGDRESLTTDSSGYIYLPTDTYEIEGIWKQSGTEIIEKINKRVMYEESGWYNDGMSITGGSDQKRRVMIRNNGSAHTSLATYVETTIEYADLSATTDPPYPFTGKGYQNMLTELQSFFYFVEKGKEHAKDAEKHLNIYRHFLKELRKDMLDDSAKFMNTDHPDMGDANSHPALRIS